MSVETGVHGGLVAPEVPRIMLLAHGSGGTTAEAFYRYCQETGAAIVTSVVYNNPRKDPDDQNHVVGRFERMNQEYRESGRFPGHVVLTHLVNRKTCPGEPAGTGEMTDAESEKIYEIFVEEGALMIACMGYTKKVRGPLLKRLKGRILNNHPARTDVPRLRGLYGMKVHIEAHKLFQEGEIDHTGVTVHQVNEEYDTGNEEGFVPVPIGPEDTPESIADNVRTEERDKTPAIVTGYARKLLGLAA